MEGSDSICLDLLLESEDSGAELLELFSTVRSRLLLFGVSGLSDRRRLFGVSVLSSSCWYLRLLLDEPLSSVSLSLLEIDGFSTFLDLMGSALMLPLRPSNFGLSGNFSTGIPSTAFSINSCQV